MLNKIKAWYYVAMWHLTLARVERIVRGKVKFE